MLSGKNGLSSVTINPSCTGSKRTAFSAKRMSTNQCEGMTEWCVESGASNHLTPYSQLKKNKFSSDVKQLISANDSKMPVKCAGRVSLSVLIMKSTSRMSCMSRMRLQIYC